MSVMRRRLMMGPQERIVGWVKPNGIVNVTIPEARLQFRDYYDGRWELNLDGHYIKAFERYFYANVYYGINYSGNTKITVAYTDIKDELENPPLQISQICYDNGTIKINDIALTEDFAVNGDKASLAGDYLIWGPQNTTECGEWTFYNFRLWDKDGTLIIELLPMVDHDGVPCLIDTTTRDKYYNTGAGTLEWGD